MSHYVALRFDAAMGFSIDTASPQPGSYKPKMPIKVLTES